MFTCTPQVVRATKLFNIVVPPEWLVIWLRGRTLAFLSGQSDDFLQLIQEREHGDTLPIKSFENRLDLSSCTIQDLQLAGFTVAFAKRVHRLRQSSNWRSRHLYLPSNKNGVGLTPTHFSKLIENGFEIYDGEYKYDLPHCLWMAKFHRMNKIEQQRILDEESEKYWSKVHSFVHDGGTHPGKLIETNFYKQYMQNFDSEMMDMQSLYCHECCEETWVSSKFTRKKNADGLSICNRCARGETWCTSKNMMVPELAPKWIRNASALTKRITAPAAALQKVYCTTDGTVRSCGHTLAIEQDLKGFAKTLPISPENTGWVQLQREGDDPSKQHSDLKLNARLARSIINWHKEKKTPGFESITFDEEVLAQLPEDSHDINLSIQVSQEEYESINGVPQGPPVQV